ncbi:MAG: EI24 domain-containing protein [Myxococcota bacterium]
MARHGPKALPHNPLAQMTRAVFYPLEGLRFIRQHQLWPLAGVAIGVNIVLLLTLLGLSLFYVWPWLGDADAWVRGLFTGELWQSIGPVLAWIVWVVAVLMVIIAQSLLLLLVGQAVASPFLDMLSEKVESIVLGTPSTPAGVGRTLKSLFMALGELCWSVLFIVIVNLPIWLVGVVVPGIGTSVAAVLSFAFGALLLSHEFVGLPLARDLVSFRRRWRTTWANRWLGLGFGSSAAVMLVVPGLNLILLPLAAVGGTLLYCDLKAAGRLKA